MGFSLRLEAVSLVRSRPGEPDRRVLDGVNAEFQAGQLSLLRGETGSGKSTIIHLLSGLMRPTEGTVWAGDDPISRWVAVHRDRYRMGLGVALQSPELLPELNVIENVMLPILPRATNLKALTEAAQAALAQLGLSELAGAEVTRLSGGQRQRVGIARAVVREPSLILLDEPSAHQDAGGVARLLGLFEAWVAAGRLVVVSSHDPRLLEAEGCPRAVWSLAEGHLEPAQP